MKELAGEAPMSGAPIATSALQAPVRARRKPQPQQTQPEPAPPAVPEYQHLPQLPQGELFSSIASIPGASSLVQSIFGSQVPAAPLPAAG